MWKWLRDGDDDGAKVGGAVGNREGSDDRYPVGDLDGRDEGGSAFFFFLRFFFFFSCFFFFDFFEPFPFFKNRFPFTSLLSWSQQ